MISRRWLLRRTPRPRRTNKLLPSRKVHRSPMPLAQARGFFCAPRIIHPQMSAPSKAAQSLLRKPSLFYFVWVMFSYCTGGPFGLEDMVTTSGPGVTLLYLLFIPMFWSIPVSLVSAELTTAVPVEGGFYRWVRAGFGDFWGFLAGWWNWCASFLLGAVYAVQFSDYLGFYI